ncbi:MAG: alpha/beta fold hydrolase, partial [Patescibacteria group bacterium]
NADGSLGSWNTTTDLPDVLWDHGMISYGDYIYVVGGKNSSGEISQVIRAKSNSDGSLSTWTNMPSLPSSTRAFGYTIVDNYIFVVGGYNGSFLNTVYYTTIDLNGQMTNWSTSSNSLPIQHASGSLAAANGYLYLIGGWISGYGYSEKVYKAKLNFILPTPTPTPLTPIIFLPGLGGSWNYEAMVHNATVSDIDWKLTPFVTVYDGLISTLKNSGYSENTNFWVYYYDWRKNISDTASSLSNFINSKSLTKVSLIGHSQGGLVARAYAQNNPSKVDKLITIASPHSGALSAYRIWEGADFSELPGWQNLLIKLYLKVNRGSYNNDVSTIQNKFPNLGNILPTFEYFISGTSPKSNYLDTLTNNSLYTISGTNLSTPRNYVISTRSSFDSLLGKWIDGKPSSIQNASGDGTVLASSSQVPGEIENLSESGEDHQQIVSNTTTLAKIQNILGVSGTIATSTQTNLDNAVLTTIASSANFSIRKPDGTIVYPQDNLILTLNPTNNYQVLVTPIGPGGNYTVYSSSFWDPITGNISSGINTHNLNTIPPITSALTHITNVYNALTNIIQRQDALRIKSYINDFNSAAANTKSGFDVRATRLFGAIDLLITKAKNTTVTENLRLIKSDIEQLRINRFGN